MNNNVLIVEDEKNISDIIKYNLEKEDLVCDQAFDGEDGLNKALEDKYDLILLDIMLPGMNGFEVCKRIRKTLRTPIIMLTALEEENDKIKGLEIGADDYITKPFSPKELIARVKANIRRMNMNSTDEEAGEGKLIFGDLEIDIATYTAYKNGQELKVTYREFELLKFLAMSQSKIYSREQLLTLVWKYEYIGVDSERTVDVTVRRLREKIEDDPSNPKYIITKRGVGYYFKEED